MCPPSPPPLWSSDNLCQYNVKRSFNFTRVRLLVCVHRLALPVVNTTSNRVSHFITLKWLLHRPVRLHPLRVHVRLCVCEWVERASFTNCSVLATTCTAQLGHVEIDLVRSPRVDDKLPALAWDTHSSPVRQVFHLYESWPHLDIENSVPWISLKIGSHFFMFSRILSHLLGPT